MVDKNSQINKSFNDSLKVVELTDKSSDDKNLQTNKSWIAERDHILKKYSHRLMRKKPRSRTPRKLSTDDYLSSDIECI